MINLYDGNNVMLRAFHYDTVQLPGQSVMNLRQRFEAQTAADIWVWDGKDHNDRRREIYPPYKMNRTPKPEDAYAQVRLWRELLRHTAATQIEVHGWEADDVIGTLVRQNPGKFCVHTNDMDYGQVATMCRLDGVNLKGVPAHRVCLYKALVGDTSDNISGIPGFGPGRWLEMEPHWDEIQAAIVAGRPEAFIGLPFKPKVVAWLTSQENVKLLQDMLVVTHFQNVPADELNGGIAVGTVNKSAGRARLAEFFL